MKMSFLAFCSQNNNQAGAPGQSRRILRLQALSTKDSVDNAKVMDGPDAGASLDMHGVSKAVADGFDSGQSYVVTIETVPNSAQATSGA